MFELMLKGKSFHEVAFHFLQSCKSFLTQITSLGLAHYSQDKLGVFGAL